MANPTDLLTLHALGAEVGQGSGASSDIEAVRSAALVQLRVTAGTAQVTVETSTDGSTNWRTAGTLTPRTTTLTEELAVDGLAQHLRCSWPAGTAGTFEVTAVGHQLLVNRGDLYAKLARSTCDETEQAEPGIVARALIEATDVAVGPLGAWHDIDCLILAFGIAAGPLGEVELTLAFDQVPLSIRAAVASIAALIVLERHGFVGGGVDELVIAADARAREWLVAAGSKSSASSTAPPAQTTRWTIPTLRR